MFPHSDEKRRYAVMELMTWLVKDKSLLTRISLAGIRAYRTGCHRECDQESAGPDSRADKTRYGYCFSFWGRR